MLWPLRVGAVVRGAVVRGLVVRGVERGELWEVRGARVVGSVRALFRGRLLVGAALAFRSLPRLVVA